MTKRHVLAASALAGVMFAALPATPVFAAGSSEAASSAQSTDSSFSDKQLKQFVKAQDNVQAALKKWNAKIESADDDAKKKKLKTGESKALVKAVKDSGLDPETYNNIAQAAQKDPDLTKRIQSFMTPQ